MTSLLHDIFKDILLRLPFESILTCKLVSKQWNNVINDPEFSRLYADNCSSTALFMSRGIVYCLFKRHRKDDSPPPFKLHRIPIGLRKNKKSAFNNRLLSGSSNNIVCVKSSNGHFCLYSLLKGSSYAVKDAPLQQHSTQFWLSYGFGYDSYAHDYKIMVVCTSLGWLVSEGKNAFQNKDNSLFWIYSFRNRGWKPFKGFPYAAYNWSFKDDPYVDNGSTLRDDPDVGAYSFNGVLHWLVARVGQNRKDVIVTYDLRNNNGSFGEMLVPSSAAYYDDEDRTTTLGEINRRLCLVTTVSTKVDVWMMKEYGARDSWEILSSDNLGWIFHWVWMTPTFVLERGDGRIVELFVCNYGDMLVWCDINKNKVEIMTKKNWPEKKSITEPCFSKVLTT